jgi:hypothetical protein
MQKGIIVANGYIWEDKVAMVLLIGGHLEAPTHEVSSIKRAKKKVMKYHWAEDTLFFKELGST